MEKTKLHNDVNFGIWLSRRRCQAGWSLEEVSSRTKIAVARLRSLEIAQFLKGITMKEISILSELYKIPAASFITQMG